MKVFDTISEKESQRICAESIGPSGGEVTLLIKPAPGATTRTDVGFKLTNIYTSLGHSGSDPLYTYFLGKVPGLVKDGSIMPPALRLWEGGLASVLDGMQYMREGKVSAEKVVYRVMA
ncbi:hypothetical protein C8T65DRAFT_734283 [Cerioporus squamosus]|nr:hypothetical protein C8T65DRAFT_734283 [Cerioporus squamosus]